jgi:class 3 adenylate cyclase
MAVGVHPIPKHGRSTLLLVDDVPENLDVLVGVLQADFDLKVANRGAKALKICESGARIDLILLDVMMPEMDGFEVCRILRSTPATQHIPIIFITARTAVNDIVRGFELGAVDYVAKPFNAAELLARVNTHLTVDRLLRENERLLLNILPAPVAERLKVSDECIAEHHAAVSVLFADIVGFTALSEGLMAQQLVEMLNELFTRFDALARAHGVEKIKTIGDCYMAASGLPEARADHATALADMALEMLETLRQFNADHGRRLQLRIGLNSGPVVAGVIGRSKFIYDLWGDTVNTASRMASNSLPDTIQVTGATRQLLLDQFVCEERGELEIKGKGRLHTWFLRGRRTNPAG